MNIELQSLYADFPDEMTWNPPYKSTPEVHKVIFSDADTAAMDNGIMAADPFVRFIAAEFDRINTGDTVMVNGKHYRIREVRKITYGKEKIASLAEISL